MYIYVIYVVLLGVVVHQGLLRVRLLVADGAHEFDHCSNNDQGSAARVRALCQKPSYGGTQHY